MAWTTLLAPLKKLNDWELIALWNSYSPIDREIYFYRHQCNLDHLEYIGQFVAWDEDMEEYTSFDFFDNYGSLDDLAYWMYQDGWEIKNGELWREL